jgi:acyl carrier protein
MDAAETRDKAYDVIYRALRAVNELVPAENRVRQSPDERLIGPEGKLDSLGYINFVAALEQEYEIEFGRSIVLAGVAPGDEAGDPFRTVATLADELVLRSRRQAGPDAGGRA